MEFFDLNSESQIGDTFAFERKEIAYEYRKNHFLSTDGLSTKLRISKMRGVLSRQLQSQKFFMLGPVSLHGFCATDLSGESSGYPGMPSCDPRKIISYGHPRQSVTQHSGQCQQRSGLAHLRRFRPGDDRPGQVSLRRRRFRRTTGPNGLRAGFHNYRPVSFAFSVGDISQAKGRNKNAYASGFARKHTLARPYNKRECARCQHPRRTFHRAGGNLHHGPCLRGFRKTLQDKSMQGFFCDPCQKQFQVQAPLLSSNRQIDGVAMRSDYCTGRFLPEKELPRKTAANSLLGRRLEKTVCVFNEQFRPAGTYDNKTLQMSLASGIVLQMDQTTFANQGFLWYFGKRSENTNLDCHNRLRAGGDSQEAPEPGHEPLHNSTDFECDAFRENPHFTGADKYGIHKSTGGGL